MTTRKTRTLAVSAALMLAAGGMATATQAWASTQGRRATAALNLLEAKGYSSFSDFRPDGRNFTATVTAHGKTTTVVVDPDTGSIQAD